MNNPALSSGRSIAELTGDRAMALHQAEVCLAAFNSAVGAAHASVTIAHGALVRDEEWRAQHATLEFAHDVPRLAEIERRGWANVARIENEIAASRPACLRDAVLKFRTLLERSDDGGGGIDDRRPFMDFLTDLETLALTSDRGC
jgi:hypothetical protein